MSVTPNRKTCLFLDATSKVQTRRGFDFFRTGAEIARARQKGSPESRETLLLAGGVWSIRPVSYEMARLATQEYHDALITAADLSLAPGIAPFSSFLRSALPGVGAAANLIQAGAPFFIKGVPADATDWGQYRLKADQDAFPGPELTPAQQYPLDRVVAGKVSYGANAGFTLAVDAPAGMLGADAYFTFYFGGNAPVAPEGQTGGTFALVLRGSGELTLFERDGSDPAAPKWRECHRFEGGEPAAGAGFNRRLQVIHIHPYADDRIAVRSAGGGGALFQTGVPMFPLGAFVGGGGRSNNLYHETRAASGHTHLEVMTGPGVVRVDHRRDLRVIFALIRHKFPAVAHLTDDPILLPRLYPAGTPLKVTIHTYLLNQTGLEAKVYDADTHAELATDNQGRFLTVAGQRKYYVRFTFATDDPFATPILRSYTVHIDPLFEMRTALTTSGGNITGVSIAGPDLKPDQEGASLQVTDPRDQLLAARARDGIRAAISVVHPVSGALISHLFEGDTWQAVAKLRGKPGIPYPVPDWREYPNLRLIGLWNRIVEQFAENFRSFAEDEDAEPDPQAAGKKPPWKITSVIRYCFQEAGVPDDELDIPDLPLRLWPGETKNAEEFAVLHGTDLSLLILTLAWDYLGRIILRDPNAGTRGMWRLLRNPTPPYTNFVGSFLMTRPVGASGKLPMTVNAFGVNTAVIDEGTFTTWKKRPEVNEVIVRGQTSAENPEARQLLVQTLQNWNSLYNPNHRDFLEGRVVTYSRPVDPGLQTWEAVNWIARRIYDQAAVGEDWFGFRAPLLLIADPLDPLQVRPRPHRINDLVYVGGVPSVIRSCNPDYDRSDTCQMAFYEGKFLA